MFTELNRYITDWHLAGRRRKYSMFRFLYWLLFLSSVVISNVQPLWPRGSKYNELEGDPSPHVFARGLKDQILKEWNHTPTLSSKSIAKPSNRIPDDLRDKQHGVKMGLSDSRCDDGKTFLEQDWDGSPVNYTCYTPTVPLAIRKEMKPIEECRHLPKDYFPTHFCMDRKIHYNDLIPTYGPHRPLWPMFGEYRFVPPQRWLHNVEHGAVVMLYHPCTHPALVGRLRALVTKCIRKHVITPSNQVSEERPLVLVTWGCKLQMNTVNSKNVVSFIRRTALNGPEGTYPKEGQYFHLLLQRAVAPSGSDMKDSNLCPYMA